MVDSAGNLMFFGMAMDNTTVLFYALIGFIIGPFAAWYYCGYYYKWFKTIRPGDVLGGLVLWAICIVGWPILCLYVGADKVTDSKFWKEGVKIGKDRN